MSEPMPSFASKLAGRGRKPMRVSSHNLVTAAPLHAGQSIPLVVRPAIQGVKLLDWAKANREFVDTHLLEHGAVLFRGFDVTAVEAFEAFAAATSTGGLVDYSYASTPRHKVSGAVYTSTEYPAEQSIPMHNEMSYTRSWPMKIWFFCVKAAPQGGATPIVDSGRVFQGISSQVRDKFIRHGVMYVRNYRQNIDLSPEQVFGTNDPAEIEQFCKNSGIECSFGKDGMLTTRQRCQAVATHPQKGHSVWFNQAHLFHVSSLDPALKASLLDEFGPEGLPRTACYGDGSMIEDEDLNVIRSAYTKETVSFPWEEGDILMLDNMQVAHGREPFSGVRKIVVAMAEQSSAGAILPE